MISKNLLGLAMAQMVAFGHIFFGMAYSKEVSEAYQKVGDIDASIILFLSLIGAFSSQGLYLSAVRSDMPRFFWQNKWKCLMMGLSLAMCATILSLFLWKGFASEFLRILPGGYAIAALTAINGVILLTQAGYWLLLATQKTKE